jgi:hypothetical protein
VFSEVCQCGRDARPPLGSSLAMDEGETGFSGKEEVCGKESVILCYLRTEKRNGNEKYDTGCHVPLWDLGLFCSLSLIQLQLSVQSSLWKYIEFLSVI